MARWDLERACSTTPEVGYNSFSSSTGGSGFFSSVGTTSETNFEGAPGVTIDMQADGGEHSHVDLYSPDDQSGGTVNVGGMGFTIRYVDDRFEG